MPLMGMTGKIKKSVINRNPVFRTNCAFVPQLPQCITFSVSAEPHLKNLEPMIKNMVF